MKAIPKETLIKMIEDNYEDGQRVFDDQLSNLFSVGEDWYINDGKFQMVNPMKGGEVE
ncbi:hypothetical protein [Carnobacterium maltaromaticum]|uniref:hypothetical protein n=1 Tax=Carnobacterium maltaromaticum TaxID=2751 RepID=UPI0012FC884D|nr:hypothetical protein [Carnobacterium maltaromaticum]